MIAPKSAICSTVDTVSGPRHGSRISNTSARILTLQWLRHDTDICDPRLLHGVHHGSKDTKRNVFIGPQVDGLLIGVLNLLSQLRRDLIDINRIAPEKHPLF